MGAGEVVKRTGATDLVELGAGYATKTRVLLDAMRDAGTLERYVPFDVSETPVVACADELVREYAGLHVHGIVGDFDHDLDGVPPATGPRIVAFLGGAIGNFLPGRAAAFLRSLGGLLEATATFCLARTSSRILTASRPPDDRAGVTADFNRNMLRVVSRTLACDVCPELFEHVAFDDQDRA